MPTNVFSVLRGWECLEVKGPDAKDFLNRLTSADFRKQRPGTFTPGTLLQPNGKVVLYFKSICLTDEHYLLIVPSSDLAFEAFERVHFRENFTLTPLKTRLYIRILAEEESAFRNLGVPNEKGFARIGEPLLFNEGAWNTPPIRFDAGLLTTLEQAPKIQANLRAAGFTEVDSLEPFRLRAMSAGVPNEINPTIIPLEAVLDDAVHENKGCYPGQEVIERIRAMGQVPRTLAQLRGEGEVPSTPVAIHAAEQEAGTLTSAAHDPVQGGWVGLGFIKRVFAKPDVSYTVQQKPVRSRFNSGLKGSA